MRNLFKYTKFYSGKNPEFKEGDVFRIIVPLDDSYSYDFTSSDMNDTNDTIHDTSDTIHGTNGAIHDISGTIYDINNTAFRECLFCVQR